MGELLKKYGQVRLKGRLYDIELNAPILPKIGGIVHIQSDDVRMEMTQADFYKLVANINMAKENLSRIKGVDDEQSGGN